MTFDEFKRYHPRARIDLTNQRFGRLEVIEPVRTNHKGSVLWLCRCDCGNETEVVTNNLTSGVTASCGCLAIERRTGAAINANTRHGLSRTSLHNIWCGMRARCNNAKNTAYRYYGKRGIKVCAEWDASFEAFRDWSYANGFEEGLSLDRIDVDGPYAPDNCRWATRIMQSRNKRDTVHVMFNGEMITLGELSDRTGIAQSTLRGRKKILGWSDERLADPVGHRIEMPDGRFVSYKQASEETGIPVQILWDRARRKWPSERMFEPPRPWSTKSKKLIKMPDGRMLSFRQASEETGISIGTLRCRAARGVSPEHLFDPPKSTIRKDVTMARRTKQAD